jgi:hypothetical protein
MARNYFICSVGQPDKDYDAENLTRCITNSCFVLNEYNKHKGCINEIKEGDLLILKYSHHFIGYGRAIASLQQDKDLSNNEDWTWRIDVSSWIIGNQIHKYGIQDATDGGSPYDTVKSVSRDFALKKIEEIGFPF